MERRRRQQEERVVVKYERAESEQIPASQVSQEAKENAAVRLFRAAMEVAHPGWSVVVKPVSGATRAADRTP